VKLWDTIAFFSIYGFNKTCHKDELVTTYTSKGKKLADVRIEDINPGDFVRSRDELTNKDIYIKVVDRHDHSVLPLYEFIMEDGETVRCTMDHKFRTTAGEMVSMKEIISRNLDIVVNTSKQ